MAGRDMEIKVLKEEVLELKSTVLGLEEKIRLNEDI